jgi:hypothetical protein
MRSHKDMDLKVEATTVIWCACEHCGAMGPRRITVIRGSREYTLSLPDSCCMRTADWSARGVELKM